MKTEETKKYATDIEEYGKPTVEVAWQGIPLTWEVDPDSPRDAPILYDREHCGKRYRVKDGEVYTIRLGIHSDPNGVGVISRDSCVSCIVPTASGKQQFIMALFSVAEIYPARLMDGVYPGPSGICLPLGHAGEQQRLERAGSQRQRRLPGGRSGDDRSRWAGR